MGYVEDEQPKDSAPSVNFSGRPEPLEWRKYVKPTLWGLLALYAVIFVLLNREPVTVKFVFFEAQIATFWLLLFAMVLGAGLSEGVRLLVRRRRRHEERRERERREKGE
ncbi:MAG: LapA family protein [Candidatus Nanopelagicales bacterium]